MHLHLTVLLSNDTVKVFLILQVDSVMDYEQPLEALFAKGLLYQMSDLRIQNSRRYRPENLN